MVGRGARPAEGKDKFILIDVHDTVSKPEVAKIFEHKHLFYAGTIEPGPIPAQEMPIAEGRVVSLPLRPHQPHEPVKSDLEFDRSRVIVPFFLTPYLKSA